MRIASSHRVVSSAYRWRGTHRARLPRLLAPARPPGAGLCRRTRPERLRRLSGGSRSRRPLPALSRAYPRPAQHADAPADARVYPDLVHLASPFVLGVQGQLVGRALGVPVAAHYQTDLVRYARHFKLARWPGLPVGTWCGCTMGARRTMRQPRVCATNCSPGGCAKRGSPARRRRDPIQPPEAL